MWLRFREERSLMRYGTGIEMVMTDQGMGKVTDTQAVFAIACVLRCLILLLCDWVKIGEMADAVQQCALLAEAEQEGQCKCE